MNLQAEAGFDSYYKNQFWVPVRITAANSGAAMSGRLEVAVGSGEDRVIYRYPIELPTQSRKQVTLYVHLPGFVTRLPVRLLNESGHEVATTAISRLATVDVDDLLYVVVTSEPGQLDVLQQVSGGRASAEVAYLEIADLPEAAAAWRSLDVLIFNEVDSGELSPQQQAALRAWVAGGGQLVVTGGPGWQQSVAGLADLLPVTISGIESVEDLPALRQAAGQPFEEAGPYLVTTSSLRQGELLLYQDDLPLLARRRLGSGAVTFLALDPMSPPLAGWDGYVALWDQVAAYAPLAPRWARGVQNGYLAVEAVSTLPSLALPSALSLLSFLCLYVIAAGPANYLVLKRIGRRELAWLTIPATVVLFSLFSYLIGFQIKGNDVIINQLSVAYGHSEAEQIHVESVLGLYSPRRAAYDLVLPPDALIRPFEREFGAIGGAGNIAAVSQGSQVMVQDVRVDVSGMESFLANAYRPAPAIEARATIRAAGRRPPEEYPNFELDVILENNGDLLLENASLLVGSTVLPVGDLAPGDQINQSFSLNSLGSGMSSLTPSSGISVRPAAPIPGYFGTSWLDSSAIVGSSGLDDLEAHARRMLVDSLSPEYSPTSGGSASGQSAVTLIAWSEQPQIEASIADGDADIVGTTLYFLSIPIEESIMGQSLSVPASLMDVTLLDQSGGVYPDSQNQFTLAPASYVELAYRPWTQFRGLAVSDLQLQVDLAGSASSPLLIRLYDWQAGKWGDSHSTTGGQIEIADYESFLGPGNAVHIHVQNNSANSIQVQALYPVLQGELGEGE